MNPICWRFEFDAVTRKQAFSFCQLQNKSNERNGKFEQFWNSASDSAIVSSQCGEHNRLRAPFVGKIFPAHSRAYTPLYKKK